jgi:hypothetical protein
MPLESTTQTDDTDRQWQAMAGSDLDVMMHGAMREMMMQISQCI